MEQCCITFRSVTYAQRGEALLERSGIPVRLRRTPGWQMAVLGLEKSGKESAVNTKTTNTNTNMESEFNESKAGMSVASLACAICGPLLFCTGMGWILSVIAVVLGILCYKTKQGIKGVATAGIILGIVTGIPMFIMSVVISGFLTMLGMAAA